MAGRDRPQRLDHRRPRQLTRRRRPSGTLPIMAPLFSHPEIERRWREVLARVDVDAIVVPSFWNSYYLSGVPVVQWGRYAITILFRERDHVLVLPSFEATAAEANSPVRELRPYTD